MESKQFEEWLIESYAEVKTGRVIWLFYAGDDMYGEQWKTLKWAFKWGVYLEFFNNTDKQLLSFIMFHSLYLFQHGGATLEDAQRESIKKAFEVLKSKE